MFDSYYSCAEDVTSTSIVATAEYTWLHSLYGECYNLHDTVYITEAVSVTIQLVECSATPHSQAWPSPFQCPPIIPPQTLAMPSCSVHIFTTPHVPTATGPSYGKASASPFPCQPIPPQTLAMPPCSVHISTTLHILTATIPSMW